MRKHFSCGCVRLVNGTLQAWVQICPDHALAAIRAFTKRVFAPARERESE